MAITKHYKSDIQLPVNLLKSDAGVPYPFKFVFKSGMGRYEAYWDGNVGVNIMGAPTSEDTQVVVMLDKHNLPIGELILEATYYVSAQGWIDNQIHKVFSGPSGIILTDKKVDEDGTEVIPPVEFDMNLIKGEKGDKGDQGIQGLQGPKGEDGVNAEVEVFTEDFPTVIPADKTYKGIDTKDRVYQATDVNSILDWEITSHVGYTGVLYRESGLIQNFNSGKSVQLEVYKKSSQTSGYYIEDTFGTEIARYDLTERGLFSLFSTHDGTNIRVYVNAELVMTVPATAPTVKIFRSVAATPDLVEVCGRQFNKVLSGEEITEINNFGRVTEYVPSDAIKAVIESEYLPFGIEPHKWVPSIGSVVIPLVSVGVRIADVETYDIPYPAGKIQDEVDANTAALALKVDKDGDKVLSDNNYSDADVAQVATIGDKANSADVYNKTEVDNLLDAKPDTTALHVQFPEYKPTLPSFGGQQGSTPRVAGMPNLNFVYNDRGTGDGNQMKFWEQTQKNVFTAIETKVDNTKALETPIPRINTSFCFWVYNSTDTRHSHLVLGSSAFQAGDVFRFYAFSSTSSVANNKRLEANRWYLLSVVYESDGSCTLYVDDYGENRTGTQTQSDINTLRFDGIGEKTGMVAFFKHALSADDIRKIYNGGRPWEYQLDRGYFLTSTKFYDTTDGAKGETGDSTIDIISDDAFNINVVNSAYALMSWSQPFDVAKKYRVTFDVVSTVENCAVRIQLEDGTLLAPQTPVGTNVVQVSEIVEIPNGEYLRINRGVGVIPQDYTLSITNLVITECNVTHQYTTKELGVNIWRNEGIKLEAGDLELIGNNGEVYAEVTTEQPFASYGEQSGAPDYASVATNRLVRFDPATGTYYRGDGDGNWIAMDGTPVT